MGGKGGKGGCSEAVFFCNVTNAQQKNNEHLVVFCLVGTLPTSNTLKKRGRKHRFGRYLEVLGSFPALWNFFIAFFFF